MELSGESTLATAPATDAHRVVDGAANDFFEHAGARVSVVEESDRTITSRPRHVR